MTRHIILALVLLNLAVMASACLELWRSKNAYDKTNAVNAANLSLVLEKNLDNALDQVNLTLQNVADEVTRMYAQEGRFDAEALDAFIGRQHARVPALDSLRHADEFGTIKHGVGVDREHLQTIADREYFIRLRDDPSAQLIISTPMIGRISGKMVIVLARSFKRPDGTFAGVVYGPISLDYFYHLFAALDVGPGGVLSLRDETFAIIARYPIISGDGATGQRITSKTFQELVEKNPLEGTYLATTATDKIERMHSYRKVSGYPLYIIAGLSTRDYLSSWKTECYMALAIVASFIVASSLGTRIIIRAIHEKSQSEERFSLLLNSAGEGIFGVDTDGNCTFCNPVCLRMLHYSDENQLLGNNIHALTHHTHTDGSPYPAEECRILQVFRLGQDVHADDEVFWRADGTRMPVEYWASAQKRRGEVVGVVVTFADISVRKRAEAALRSSEERFRSLVEHAPQPIIMVRERVVYYANAKAAQAFGYPGSDSMRGLDVERLIPSRVLDNLFSPESAAPQGPDEDAHFETLGIRRDGEPFDLFVSSTVLDMADGRISLTFCQDITGQKMARSQIRQLGEALKQSVEAIALLDSELRFTYVNPAFCLLFGYGPDELLGQSALVLKGQNEELDGPNPLQTSTLARQQGVFRGEAKRRSKDGRMIPLLLNVAPVRDDSGNVSGYVSAMTDLTEIKQVQEELRQMAHYDTLTRLPNRALLTDRLTQGLAAAHRNGRICALLFLDLNHFKQINDTMGHHAGDLLLQGVAARLRSLVRQSDTVARLAGDEFVLFLPDLEQPRSATVVAEKILAAFEAPFDLAGNQIIASPSIGVAFYPKDGFDGPSLIKCADKAMYQAKQSGDKAYAFFSPVP